jgi:FeS assembly protein IscX
MENYPNQQPVNTGLEELVALVTALPGFEDDPALVTEQILYDILNVWYEESA